MIPIYLNNSLKQKSEQCIGDLLSKGKLLLERSGNNRAEQESVLLLSYLLGREKSYLFLNRHLPVSRIKIERYYRWIRERRKGIPIQYITGFQNFMGLEFAVSEGVFIPRAETEILVEKVIQLIEMIPEKKQFCLMDIGVGSGAIPIAICYYLQKKNKYINFHAVDISIEAIKLASMNAKKFHCQKNIYLYQGNLFQPYQENKYLNTFDGIISNPPYLSQAEWNNLPEEIRLFEPPAALLGGEKGLNFYKKIIFDSPAFLKPDGFLALEIGHQQKYDVYRMIKNNTNFQKEIITFSDYYQNDRGIIAFKNS